MLASASTSTSSHAERSRAERRPLPGLAAYHWEGSVPRLNKVRNISSTGVYLQTPDRWKPGELVTLTLQREGPPQMAFERHVRLKTKAVRWGADGVGLAFDLLDVSDLRLWDSPLKSDPAHTEPEDILREFRLAEALAFLRRIVPGSSGELRKLFREALSNYRVSAAVEIALKAQMILEGKNYGDEVLQAPEQLAYGILESGSWAEEDWIRQMWAGLLASSCTSGGLDNSNLVLVNRLSQLTPVHFRILTAACNRANKIVSGFGWTYAMQAGCTVDEVLKITGHRDRLRIERDVDHLVELGLLERRSRSPLYAAEGDSTIIPTRIGQKLCANCEGNR